MSFHGEKMMINVDADGGLTEAEDLDGVGDAFEGGKERSATEQAVSKITSRGT